jgi:hypothetical protein
LSTKKKTTENSTSVTTPTNPEWVTSGIQSQMGRINDLASADPFSFVAGPSALQKQAFETVGGLGSYVPGMYESAMQVARAGGLAAPTTASFQGYTPAQASGAQIGPASYAQAANAYGGIGAYMNPYESAVVDSTLSDMNRARQMTLADNGRSAVLAGQYGGSRQGVADALTNAEFLRGVGSTVGNLRHGGFGTALQYSNADADRTQQVGLFNASADNARSLAQAELEQQANLANQAAANVGGQFNSQQGAEMSRFNAGQAEQALARQLQAAGVLGGMGQSGLDALGQFGGTQQQLDALYRRAPLDLLQATSGMYGQQPLDLFNGQSQTRNGTTVEKTSGLGHVAGVAGGLAGQLGFTPFAGLGFPKGLPGLKQI